MVTMPREWYALLTNEAISTTQFTGRQQAAKPAVDAPVELKVRRHLFSRLRLCGARSVVVVGTHVSG
jgi:hypothetical protein